MVMNVFGVVAPLGLKLITFNCYQRIYLLIRFEARERSRSVLRCILVFAYFTPFFLSLKKSSKSGNRIFISQSSVSRPHKKPVSLESLLFSV